MYKRYVIKSKLGIPITSGKLMSTQPDTVWCRTFTCCAFVPSPPGVVVVHLGSTFDSGCVLFCVAQVRSAWPSPRLPFLPLLALSGSESGSWTSLSLDHCAEIEQRNELVKSKKAKWKNIIGTFYFSLSLHLFQGKTCPFSKFWNVSSY